MYHKPSKRQSQGTHEGGSATNGTAYGRRTPGKNVAALQSQWLAVQEQEQAAAAAAASSTSRHSSIRSTTSSMASSNARGGAPSPSPVRIRSRLSFEPGNDSDDDELDDDADDHASDHALDASNDYADGYDSQAQYYEHQQPQQYQQQAAYTSYANGNAAMPVATQPTPHYSSSQESKVAKEGWIYKRNSLMQWRQVYAVAKHGNAVKPGSLYLYKDEKFANHIHTYDMSEVVQVEPRNQDYRTGIKWEFRLLVKKEDVILATDDMSSRQAWISSLTAIMGKVSLATHSELQSKTYIMEQLNRQLQTDYASLESDNARLRQELLEAQKRERSTSSEHTARESGLTTELEHVRQNLDEAQAELTGLRDKTEDLEQQKMTWQARAQELQAELQDAQDKLAYMEEQQGYMAQDLDQLREEKKEWQHMAMTAQQQQQPSSRRGAFNSVRRNGRYNNNSHYDDYDDQQDDMDSRTLHMVKHQLQTLVDQIHDPTLHAHVSDIKTAIGSLADNLDEAKDGWVDLQTNLVKLLSKEQLNKDDLWMSVRDGLGKWQGDGDKVNAALKEIQASQDTLKALIEEKSNKESTETMERVMQQWQDEQKKWLQQVQSQWTASNQYNDENPSNSSKSPSTSTLLLEKQFLHALDCLKDDMTQSRTDTDKSFQVLGQLFQHMMNQLGELAVPDLAQPVESLMDQLLAMDERLHRIQLNANRGDNSQESNGNNEMMHPDDVREMMVSTRSFMERTLRVLDQFGGNQAGLEATVRRAVKTALNTHTERQQAHGQDAADQLQQYEEKARDYMDRSMSGMRAHFEDCTTVMYKMTEELVLRAVQHLEQQHVERAQDSTQVDKNQLDKHQLDMDLAAKEKQKKALQQDIARLQDEKQALETDIKQLGKDNQHIEVALHKKQAELQVAKDEYARLQLQVEQARQESVAGLARDLEPLVRQLHQLKQHAHQLHPPSPQDEIFSDDSGDYIDLGKAAARHHSTPHHQGKSRHSHLKGRTRASPLAEYLNQ
ncbi:hypothetical protein BC940DRAFT_112828 [Gongronella butleri]|nr:hypothetical protein BC940DRAFT_112828 [Gongronella butleri]